MVEGGGLLNRYMVNSRIEGSNPSPSANYLLTMNKRLWKLARLTICRSETVIPVPCFVPAVVHFVPSPSPYLATRCWSGVR